ALGAAPARSGAAAPSASQRSSASRGAAWLAGLTDNAPALAGFPATVRVVDAPLGNEQARYIAVVPDEANRFPRVRNGEMGLEEGWHLARAIRQWCERDLSAAGRASGGATPVDTGGG